MYMKAPKNEGKPAVPVQMNTAGEIKCLNCGNWFVCPIGFGDAESFFSSTLAGNRTNCPRCGGWTSCNKENMRFSERLANGRVTYVEGKDAL